MDKYKKRLKQRKKKIDALGHDIEEHEHDVHEAALHRTPLTDAKYAGSEGSRGSKYTHDDDDDDNDDDDDVSMTSSSKKAEDDINRMMETGSSVGKGKKTDKKKGLQTGGKKPTAVKKMDAIDDKKKEPIRYPKNDPFIDQKKDLFSDQKKDPISDQKKDPIRDQKKDPIRDQKKDPIRDQKKDHISFNKTDPISSNKKDPISDNKKATNIFNVLKQAVHPAITPQSKTTTVKDKDNTIREKPDVTINIDDDDDDDHDHDDDDDDDDEEKEDSDDEEGFFHVVDAIRALEGAKYIFIQNLINFVEIEEAGIFKKGAVDLAYQILNVEGQLLFLMAQTKLRYTGFIVYSQKSFENVLYDIYGNKVLKFIGPSVLMSKMTSKMMITDAHDRPLGYVKPFGTKVNFSVYNAVGERLFLVVSNLYMPQSTTAFTILCRGQQIGVIKYGWKNTFHDLPFIDYETSGIEFPEEMDEREKALLLGCLMLIEFFWYSPFTKLKLSLLFVALFLLTLAIIILCIPIIIDNPKDDKETKSYFVAEKLDKPKKQDGAKSR